MSITFKSNPATTVGDFPALGSTAPGFILIGADLAEVSLDQYAGQKVILNIFPSLDTGVCAASVRAFNQLAQQDQGLVVLHISLDLPFAQKRFCQADGIDNSIALSAYRSSFPDDYGIRLVDTPLKGLCTRAVLVLDDNKQVLYSELVSEITNEPNYQKVIDLFS